MNHELIDLSAGEMAAPMVLQRPPRWVRASVYLFALLLAMATVWAHVTRVETYIGARGVVRPQGDLVKVQPVASGRLLEVCCREGDRVARGAVLFRIDGKDTRTEIEKNLSQQETGRKQLAALLSSRTSLLEQQGLESAAAATAVQLASGSLEKARIEREQRRAAVTESMARVADCEADLERMARLVTGVGVSEADLSKQRAALRVANADRDASTGALEIAEQQVLLEMRAAELRQQQNAAAAATRKRDLVELEARITASEQEAKALAIEAARLEAQLSSLDVTAPVTGTVASMLSKTAGEVVQGGDCIATLVPADVPWIVEATVLNRDAGRLRERIGACVRIRLDAFPFRDYGSLTGKIVAVASDATPHEQLGLAYRVEIAPQALVLERGRRRGRIQLGMTADVEIVQDEDRLLALLWKDACGAMGSD
ncbi:MAG: HlyD family efflux transporter periplasmic adaptor subunit [Planctomycetota bacterium]